MSDVVAVIEPHDEALLIAVQKRFLDEVSTRRLTDEVLTAAAQRTGVPVVLDMSRVRFAPSVALGLLVQLSKSFKLDGRRIALIGIDRHVRDTIRVTMLHAVLEIHDTLEQVLQPPRDKK